MASGEIAVCVHKGLGHQIDAQVSEVSFFSSISASSQHGKMRSTVIVPLMNDVLSQAGLVWDELDALALGAGPGSFTGLRIAAATLAGINSGLSLPILHLSSLAITARQAASHIAKASNETLWVLEDARAGEVFVGAYRNDQPMQADHCLNWSDVETMKSGHYCCHGEPACALDGWVRVPLDRSRSAALALEVESLCASGILNLDALPRYPAPQYLQLSQAERHAHA